MNQFLSYEIFGLITVQTYLIVMVLDFALCSTFNRKNRPASKLIGQAILWPLIYVVNIITFVVMFIVFVIAILRKTR